jgi:hypothetical protein
MKLLFRFLSSKNINCLHKFKIIFVFFLVINNECLNEFILTDELFIESDVINKNEYCCNFIFPYSFLKLKNELIEVLTACLKEFHKSGIIAINYLFSYARLIDMIY